MGGSLSSEASAIGGLVGTNNRTITRSYATGAAGAGGFVENSGGLVGSNSGTIGQSFSTGSPGNDGVYYVKGPGGGIAGYNNGNIGADVYWDANASGVAKGVAGGTPMPAANGLTTAQMSASSSFAGWSFGPGGIWSMPAGATHPVPAWQVPH